VTDPNFLKLVTIEIFLPKDDVRFYPQIEVELRDKYNKNERFIAVISMISLAKEAKLTDLRGVNNAMKFFEQGKQVEEEEEI
jgi:general stress protein 26